MTGVLSRMLEIVFIHSVRRMAGDQQGSGGRDGRDDRDVRQGGAGGFIAALGDVGVSRALHAIHAAPQEGWTVELLAGRVGMSRARFADVFVRKVGVPPMAYLTQWRLLKARTLLAGTNLNLEEIALRCGYASGASFSRRFKQEFDMGPGAYRKTSRALPV